MTVKVMAQFGVEVERLALNKFRVHPPSQKGASPYTSPKEYTVEADASSATYPLAVAAVTGGSVTVRGVGKDSLQGDADFCELLGRMGCKVERGADWTRVTGPSGQR